MDNKIQYNTGQYKTFKDKYQLMTKNKVCHEKASQWL